MPGSSLSRHLESGVDPGNEVDESVGSSSSHLPARAQFFLLFAACCIFCLQRAVFFVCSACICGDSLQ